MKQTDIFYQAFLNKDTAFEGIFIAGIKTTGIFCRPTCTARKAKRENIEFFTSTREALEHGYRACKICVPMEKPDQTPAYIAEILKKMHDYPQHKIKDLDLRNMGYEPSQIRRWFIKHHGITFQAYQRMQKINQAVRSIQNGERVVDVAFDSGYESLSGFTSRFQKFIGHSPVKSKQYCLINMTRIETELGPMIACATEKGLCMLEFADHRHLDTELQQISKTFNAPIIQGTHPVFDQLEIQLSAYFAGTRARFDLPLDLVGTVFQKAVWQLLLTIPYAQTISYATEAKLLGKPNAVRAVANANGKNKISIIIPCHRVVGQDGSLTGYGGGLWRKKKLLSLEQYHQQTALASSMALS